MKLITAGTVLATAEQLTGPGTLEVRPQPRVALNVPPNPHRPGGPHIDGAAAEPDGRPSTFSLLVGVLLSDQTRDDMGNLWVWPGSHLSHQNYFREHGPDELIRLGGYIPVALGEPEQVRGRPGDVILAHHLLGHNIGGNTSAVVRRAVYFRLKHRDHDGRWRDCLRDAWADFAPCRHTTP
jgi:ectoine hydroxylase-related dioxygenase (phytanoyl-CoA dioxygenase family)